jgi:arsenate reductase (glutaredoxin)
VDVVIYHNPACGTSRNALALIRHCGIEPHIIEYLKTPPSGARLLDLIKRAGLSARALLRVKGTPFHEPGLNDPALGDATLIDAMLTYPILINRPLVVSPLGVRLCRPSEIVLDILPPPPAKEFRKEEGDLVLDRLGHRVELS